MGRGMFCRIWAVIGGGEGVLSELDDFLSISRGDVGDEGLLC